MSIKTVEDFRGLVKVGKIVGGVLRKLTERLQVGMTTLELDEIGARLLKSHEARPAPKFIYGFPGSILISLNDEAVHGIPRERRIKAGDLVKIDVTAEHNGYIADAASTVALAPTSSLTRRLAACARAAFRKGLRAARSGRPLSDIGKAVESQVTRNGFRVIRELHGHGVGRVIHEEPTVYNFYNSAATQRLTEGLVLTIEPIITSGSGQATTSIDGWTVKTLDGCPAAHYEHTVVITRRKPLVLTALGDLC